MATETLFYGVEVEALRSTNMGVINVFGSRGPAAEIGHAAAAGDIKEQ